MKNIYNVDNYDLMHSLEKDAKSMWPLRGDDKLGKVSEYSVKFVGC